MNLESDEVISFMSEQTTTQINFNEALNILNNISKESFSSDVWIPSLKRSVKIQEITAKQQKTLIESAIDSTVLKSTFSKYFYEIVCSNCSEDKEIVEKYNSKISTLFSEHVKIFRLFFVELSNKKSDYWGKLSLEGSNYDILKQIYENKTQKSVINMEKNNLILMRFKKVIMVSPDKAIEEINITSLSDSELVPMKM